MDGIYCSKGEEEEEVRRLQCPQGDLEECIRTLCPANLWRPGICELLPYFEASDLTRRSPQNNTLDHRPPMSQAEFDALVTSILRYLTTQRSQPGAGCPRGYYGRHTPQDNCKGFLRLVLCPIESGREGANRRARSVCPRLRRFLTPSGLHRVFKPKDEEPYGRLNPKVSVRTLRTFGHPAETPLLQIDDQVATQTSL